ncbi:MAG: MmcQ/YjbR family DNA-binding protein [Atopobiaceae bacterium]|nr:MmcQ/YjbR family DNA-binding protein [Atopobiaceae bacterium]
MTLDDVHEYLLTRYGLTPTRAFKEDPSIGVFVRPDSKKWFAATKNIRCRSVDVEGDGRVDILNVKLDPRVIASLRIRQGFLPAWHMNRNKWVTVLLDGTVHDDEARSLIDRAYTYAG